MSDVGSSYFSNLTKPSQVDLANPETGYAAPANTPGTGDYIHLNDQVDALHGHDRYGNISQNLGMGVASVLLGTAETFVNSIPLLPTVSVENYLKGSEMGDYYSRNQDWAKTVGDMLTFYIPGTAAEKAYMGGSKLMMNTVKGEGIASRLSGLIFASGQDSGELLAGLRSRSLLDAQKWGAVDWSRTTGPETWKADANSLLRTSVVDTLKRNIAFEAGVYATMNQSQTLYPDDWSAMDYLKFQVPLPVGAAAVENLFLRRQIGQIATDAGRAGYETLFGDTSKLVGTSRTGSRDISLSQNQYMISKLDEAQISVGGQLDNQADRTELANNIKRQKVGLDAAVVDDITAMAKDKPWNGVTSSWVIGNREINTVRDFGTAKPYDMLNVASLEPIADEQRAAGDFIAKRMTAASGLDKEIEAQKKTVGVMSFTGDPAMRTADLELTALRNKRADLSKLTPVVIGPDGITSGYERGILAQDWLDAGSIRVGKGDKVTDGNKITFIGSNSRDLKGMEISLSDFEPTLVGTADTKAAQNGEHFLGGVSVGKIGDKYPGTQTVAEIADINKRLEAGDMTALRAGVVDSDTFTRILGTQTLSQRTGLMAGYERAISDFVDGTKTEMGIKPISLDPTRHYIFADMADMLYQKLGPADFGKFVALPGKMTIDDARMIGLQGKYRDFNIWQDMVLKDPEAAKALGFNPTNFRYYTNLPQAEGGIDDGILSMFRQLRLQGDKNLVDSFKDVKDFYKGVNTSITAPEQIGLETLMKDQPVQGKLMDWGLGEKKAVVAVYREARDPAQSTYSGLISKASQQRDETLNIMQNSMAKFGDLIGQLVFEKIDGTAAALQAQDIGGLGQGSIRGSGTLTTRNLAGGDAPPVAGMQLIDSLLNKLKASTIEKIYETTGLGLASKQLESRPVFKQNFYDFKSARSNGWDLLSEPEIAQDGSLKFKLDTNSTRNERMLQDLHGIKMEKDGDYYMPSNAKPSADGKMVYQPLVVKPEVAPMIQSTQKMADLIANAVDAHAAAVGKSAVQRRPFWIPPINLQKKHVTFLRDGITKEMVTTATGDTPAELRKSVEAIKAEYNKVGKVLEEETPGQDINTYSSYDEAFDKLINMSDPLTQTAGTRGRLGDPSFVDAGNVVMKDLHESYQAILDNLFRRSRVLYFEPYIKQARQLDTAIEQTARTTGNAMTTPKKYLQLAYSSSQFDTSAGIGKIYTGITDKLDEALVSLQEKLAPGTAKKLQIAEGHYNEYAKYMGTDNPYTDAIDYGNRVIEHTQPLTFRQAGTTLNHLTSALTLRMFELGQPLLNGISLVATTPAVIKAMARMPNETMEAWHGRLAQFGTPTGNGDFGLFSGTRALTSGIHSYWNRMIEIDGKEVKLSYYLADQGMFSQTVNDMQDTISRPQMSQWRQKLENTVNFFSKPADQSEVLSRAFAVHTGWEFGEKGLGISNPKDLLVFSHDFANKVIGDYNPANRPQIFQGSMGLPLGLFTTFMWNYNERLFRYIENKNSRAFMTQLATQAALFGVNSVPGYSQYVNLFASNYDGTSAPAVGLRNRFGDNVADALMYGSISNLPKWFGADDGLAMYQRGDAGLKMIPTFYNPKDSPAVQAVTKMYQATGKIISALHDGGATGRQVAETAAQYSLSRPFKGAVELYYGKSLDNQDRIINSDTRTTMGIIARTLGMKTLAEAKNQQAFYEIGAGRAARAERLQELSGNITAGIRAGEYRGDKGAEVLSGQLRDYVKNGGDASAIGELMRNLMIKGSVDRDTAEVSKLMAGSPNDKKMDSIKRLIWSRILATDNDFSHLEGSNK